MNPPATVDSPADPADLVAALPRDFAGERLAALRRGLLLYELSLRCDDECRDLSVLGAEHYGTAGDELGEEALRVLYELDGSALLGEILYEVSCVLAHLGEADPDQDPDRTREFRERARAVRDGVLGQTARGEGLPVEEQLAVARQQVHDLQGIRAMGLALLDLDLAGIVRVAS